ncbi:MAG TPA: PASTA domain-containing protein, partial [Deltaproteobacteria bacterium]|nr:PASTA domain-containing protein [Deltaproteobacteria bacterium]
MSGSGFSTTSRVFFHGWAMGYESDAVFAVISDNLLHVTVPAVDDFTYYEPDWIIVIITDEGAAIAKSETWPGGQFVVGTGEEYTVGGSSLVVVTDGGSAINPGHGSNVIAVMNGGEFTHVDGGMNTVLYEPMADMTIGAGGGGNRFIATPAISVTDLTEPPVTTVPPVVGLLDTDAEDLLTDAGLLVGAWNSLYSSSVPVEHIVSQDPPSGTSVPVGSSVTLTTSLGAPSESSTVPHVVGLLQATAESSITGAVLVVGAITVECSATVPAGIV